MESRYNHEMRGIDFEPGPNTVFPDTNLLITYFLFKLNRYDFSDSNDNAWDLDGELYE